MIDEDIISIFISLSPRYLSVTGEFLFTINASFFKIKINSEY